ncbi:Rhomboid protease [Purpureocillium takamizusanense]|uniref:Rhomboid protease n=1 Tax=Purpureocillium takamizusanense TaxID=2060973 RepID=A0A9Q8V7F7_9HYPO|nr:Rhomboid protease [Purpureocillium takamizusanense]UNI14762.1 Rhomboid protease [Purpureocillium takamizusanense]
MSAFICSDARRALLRVAARSATRSACAPSSVLPLRCLFSSSSSNSSSSASQTRSITSRCQKHWQASGILHRPASDTRSRRSFFSSTKIIRDYEELPRDYRDQTGLAFRAKDLTDEEAKRIFGLRITAAAANHLLRILHGRRVAGTLEDPAFAVHTAQFSPELIAAGLAYLRETVPVGEVMNAGLRAEDELNQMELEREEAEKRKRKGVEEAASEKTADEDEVKIDPVYGRSSFDAMRARIKAKDKARERALEEERKAKEAEEPAAPAGPLAKREDGTRAITNPKIAEYYAKAQSTLEAPPEMRAWERIVPSATVVALVLGFMAAVAMVYEEPMQRYRLLREVSTAQATVGAMIAVNVAVFLAWRVPPLWKTLNKWAILVVATPRPVTLFTAVFSHTKTSHLLVNMVPLWFVGTALHEELGRADFSTLYAGCGAVGFLGSLTTYTLRGWLTVTSLGASGATLGLCAAYFWEHRRDGFKILGLPANEGVHGIVFLALIAAVQLAGLGRTMRYKVDVASHLTGMAAGVLGMELLNRTERRRGRRGGEGGAEVIELWTPEGVRGEGAEGELAVGAGAAGRRRPAADASG